MQGGCPRKRTGGSAARSTTAPHSPSQRTSPGWTVKSYEPGTTRPSTTPYRSHFPYCQSRIVPTPSNAPSRADALTLLAPSQAVGAPDVVVLIEPARGAALAQHWAAPRDRYAALMLKGRLRRPSPRLPTVIVLGPPPLLASVPRSPTEPRHLVESAAEHRSYASRPYR